ncbi:DUF2268 domain-containing putative Zn-dependent protease [Bacteroidota bacterium]
MINNQEFEILTAYDIIDNFIAKKSSYLQDVFKQIENEFNHNAEYPFILETIKKEIKPDESLKEELELLKEIDFVQIVDSAFQTITKELPGPTTKILFIPINPEYREFYKKFEIGMYAITVRTGKIIVSIDPTFNNWSQLLPYVLAHEYHHSVWTSRNFTTVDFTPLEYLVLEGRADSFARELFPNTTPFYINMLTENQEKKIWNLIKPELNNRKSDMNDNMMIGTDEIPVCSGYTIGYNIIKSFKMNNPQINDRELIDITPEQILLLSKYDE